MRWRTISFGGVFLAATSVALSSVHPWGDIRGVVPGPQILQGSAVPDDVRGILEGQVARGGLEDPQRIQGRQAINHAINELFLCKE